MWVAITAICVFFIIKALTKNKKQSIDNTITKTNEHKEIEVTPLNIQNKIVKRETPSYRKYEYYNHFKEYYGTYDDISPAMARKRADKMAYSSRFDNDKYHDLKNRGFSHKNEERLKEVEKLEGEDLRCFFIDIFNDQEDYVTSVVMDAVFKKLSVHDEPLLLEAIKNIPPKEVTSWLITKKSEGFFFTEKVYQTAWERKYSS